MSKQCEQDNSHPLAVIQLVDALESNNLQIVKKLIQDGLDVNYNKCAMPFLFFSVLMKRTDIALELIKHGADVNATNDPNSHTPLSSAISGSHTAVVLELIKHGVDLSVRRAGCTPVQQARGFGYDKIVTLLEEGPVIQLLYLHPPKSDSSLSTTELELLKNKLNNLSFADLQEIYSLKNITDNTFISYKKCLMNLVDAETSKELDRVFREVTNKNIPFVDILRTLQTYTPEGTKNYTELNKKYQEINKLIDTPLDYILEQLKACNGIIENIKLDFVAGKEEAAKCLEYIALQYSAIKNLKLPNFENLKEDVVVLNIDFNYEEVPQTIEESLANLNIGASQHILIGEEALSVVGDDGQTEM